MSGRTNRRTARPPDDTSNKPHSGGPGEVPAPRQACGPELVFSPDRLRAWRHARNVDRPALVEAAGITLADLTAYETGQAVPTPGMIAAWSALLGCPSDQLRSATPDAPNEYWRAASQAMPPMSPEDLAVVARVFARTAAQRASRAAGGAADVTGGDRAGDG